MSVRIFSIPSMPCLFGAILLSHITLMGVSSCGSSDADGDGWASGEDCDDQDAANYPGAIELCDGRDNDCDGQIDDGLETSSQYVDGDGDGYGDSGKVVAVCGQPAGFSTVGGDCDDDDAAAHPGGVDSVVDGVDGDCDGSYDRVAQVAGLLGEGGPATMYALTNPLGVAISAAGELMLSDSYASRIMRVDGEGIIYGFAGTGNYGSTGDGGPAAGAELSIPGQLRYDRVGNLYVADTLANRVRRVSPEGLISTVAGNGSAGFSGDGGPATGASLNEPQDVYIDAGGVLYIADSKNNRVRRVGSDGIITTLAGNGAAAFGGDGGDARQASLYLPYGVLGDAAGNLYIADTLNGRIRLVSPGGSITTIAGSGLTGYMGDGAPAPSTVLYGPTGLAIDQAGSLHFSEMGMAVVRKIDLEGNVQTVVGSNLVGFEGDGGPATEAVLSAPMGIAFDGPGNLYVADTINQRIRRVDAEGIITTVVGMGDRLAYGGDGGPATNASLTYPASVRSDDAGTRFVADNGNQRIRRIDASGVISTFAGNGAMGLGGDGGPATRASLNYPQDIASGPGGELYIADTCNHRIRKVGTDGVITTVAGYGAGGCSSGGSGRMEGLEASPSSVLAAQGAAESAGEATSTRLNSPEAVAVDAAGNLFIADTYNQVVRKVTPDGSITTVAGTGRIGYSGDGKAATNAQLSFPCGLAVNSQGELFIADTLNGRVRKVGVDGVIETVAGNGKSGYGGDGGPATQATLSDPMRLAMDAQGRLYIADLSNQRIRMVNLDGIITTVAGTGSSGHGGEGASATQTSLASPAGVGVDRSGKLLVADSKNNRVLEIVP